MIVEKFKEYFIRTHQLSERQILKSEELERIEWMTSEMSVGNSLAKPSRYWEELNKMNMEQLKENGYENFKRTITLNYFTWTRLLPWDSQLIFLYKHLPLYKTIHCFFIALRARRHSYFSSLDIFQSFFYNFLSLLMWEYLLQLPIPADFLALTEPDQGNPALVFPRPNLKVSQDLANSLLEYDSFFQALPKGQSVVALELGAGYGRNAYVCLRLLPQIKYIVVDIPPALWVAERYLGEVFPEKNIFKVRHFERFETVKSEFDRADIIFLLSSQLSLLPDQSVDLILNISSLHEMRKDQIGFYFVKFDSILRSGGHFYFKQWRNAKVLFEGLTLEEKDYPIPAGWTQIFSRCARVQTKFFEALYEKEEPSPHF